MGSEVFNQVFSRFCQNPCGKTAFQLIQECKKMIFSQAVKWCDQNLSLEEKIREIVSEMLLILLEDFDSKKATHPNAIFRYLSEKIKRLTIKRKSRMVFVDDFSSIETGRYNFSALKLQLADEIVSNLRHFLLTYPDPKVVDLEFLFIHIYPEVRWISRLLAENNKIEEEKQIEADKKRHIRFNKGLRTVFKNLQNGDFSEISDWSNGERSHLAWRIISIAPFEVSDEVEKQRQELEDWREIINRREAQLPDRLNIARKVLENMKQFRKYEALPSQIHIMAEETAPYGEEQDLLFTLIGCLDNSDHISERESEWALEDENINFTPEAEKIFEQVTEDLCNWFDSLVTEKYKCAQNQKNEYNYPVNSH